MQPERKVILFDLGGVLIENAGRDGLMGLLPYRLETPEIWRRWLDSPAVQQFESGRIAPDAFAAQFIREWELTVGPEAFLAEFASWPRGFFPGARELLAALRDRHHLACLSNTNAIHWGRFPEFRDVFDTCFASHEMGIVKPDHAAYAHVLETLGVEPSDVHFFDDLLPNVEAARAVGINAYQVSGFAQIEPLLREARLHRQES